MHNCSLLRRPFALFLSFVLAVGLVPLDIDPAEAGRIKLRFRSGAASTYTGKADNQARAGTGSNSGFRFHSFSGSGSPSDSADSQDKRSREGAAAVAAERARAALEAENPGRAVSGPVYQPIPIGKTTKYDNGVMCVAGC